jgi:methylated-DNA-[protein]-cysteine S-methyltransferase
MGYMLVVTDDQGRLRALDWESHAQRMQRLLDRQYGRGAVRLVESSADGVVAEKLKAYFDGDVTAVDDIPTETAGTPFQREIWAALRAIPAGETWSYGRLATHIGRPEAVRAVGLASGANPINVVVPCHRVIGADGSLTGYGGGLDRKKWLLGHEGAPVKEA